MGYNPTSKMRVAGKNAVKVMRSRSQCEPLISIRVCLQMGGTGLRPVVSGVPPETVAGRELALVSADNQQQTTSDEIRRNAGFDGRDGRATILEIRPSQIPRQLSAEIP